jgi:hypothetical protein
MHQPFLLFVRKRKTQPPTDQELAKMGYSLAQLKALIQSVDQKQTDLLRGMPAGSYRVTLVTAGVNHMSFNDSALLEAADEEVQYANSLRTMKIVRTYTLSFFDEVLQGKTHTVLNRTATDDPLVTVEWFPPAPKLPMHPSRWPR